MSSFWNIAKTAQAAQNSGLIQSMYPSQSPVVPIPGGPQNQAEVQHMKFVDSLSPPIKTMLNSISQMNDADRRKFGYAIAQMQIDRNYIAKYENMIKRIKGQA